MMNDDHTMRHVWRWCSQVAVLDLQPVLWCTREPMCGIVAALVAEGHPAVAALYEALLALQHRGQDAAGIVTEDEGRLCLRKDNGMVRDVFSQEHVGRLTGNIGIGHVRYPTAGTSCSSEAQPFYVNSPFGITLAHNGNLVNTASLQAELQAEWRHLNTGSDSEVLLNVLAAALLETLALRSGRLSASPEGPMASTNGAGGESPGGGGEAGSPPRARISAATDEDILASVKHCMRRCIGGYAVVAMITNWGVVAFRDPHGVRPLVYGRRRVEAPKTAAKLMLSAAPTSAGSMANAAELADAQAAAAHEYEYIVASESGALNALGVELIADVPAGHCLMLRKGEAPQLHDCLPGAAPRPALAPCVFEYVYFARPDSVLDGVSVYRTRLRMGEKLAQKIQRTWADNDIDVVIPVPDTARTAAIECASVLKLKYREGFIKNRYIGRTFIMPQQGLRKKSVRQKLAPIASEFVGRSVLLVDDSIVRGTTSREIIEMARDAGARKVYMASAAPPVRYPNVYGIDMPTREELVANRAAADDSVDNLDGPVAGHIGADRVVYQELGDLCDSITEEASECGANLKALDCSCFNGVYITSGAVGSEYLTKLASTRKSDRGTNGSSAMHALDRLEIPKKARRA
jgi:amidophosphoribosyltransferase